MTDKEKLAKIQKVIDATEVLSGDEITRELANQLSGTGRHAAWAFAIIKEVSGQ